MNSLMFCEVLRNYSVVCHEKAHKEINISVFMVEFELCAINEAGGHMLNNEVKRKH